MKIKLVLSLLILTAVLGIVVSYKKSTGPNTQEQTKATVPQNEAAVETLPEYYPTQLGGVITLNGIEYVLVSRPSLNVYIKDKTTDFAGVLRRSVGTTTWGKYVQILSNPDSAKNNPYDLYLENNHLLLLIVDQNGAGSGEGIGKVIDLSGSVPSFLKCVYVSQDLNVLNTSKLIDSKTDNHCHDYEIKIFN
ncbi:MAG TPA: hypothetical protein VFG51_00775 [Candidatus Saccharimonadia bacterium]|nr:hypothetical protein [Candidatus Saccharimonadia bacterium]